jgi:hypothetical protein
MRRLLQIMHLSFLFLIPITFTILKITANDYDPIIILTNKASVVLGTIWASYFTIELLKTGSNEDLKPSLLKRYRKLLGANFRFLIVSNIILLFIFCVLIYQFVAYRNVEFIASKNTELFESHTNGAIEKIGDIIPNKITTFRVRTGIRYFLFKDPSNEEFTSIQPIEVPYFYANKKIDRIKLIQDDKFEILK